MVAWQEPIDCPLTSLLVLTPNMLMLGKEIRLSTEIVFGSLDNTGETISSYGSYEKFMRERMLRAHGIAQKHLASSAKRQK